MLLQRIFNSRRKQYNCINWLLFINENNFSKNGNQCLLVDNQHKFSYVSIILQNGTRTKLIINDEYMYVTMYN